MRDNTQQVFLPTSGLKCTVSSLFPLILATHTVVFLFISFLTSPWRDLLSTNETTRRVVSSGAGSVCAVDVYSHTPISLRFTAAMHPSLRVLDQNECDKALHLIKDVNLLRCPTGALLQCVEGWCCSLHEDKRSISNLNISWSLRRWVAQMNEPRPWMNVYHGGKSPSQLVHQGNAVLSALGLAHVVQRIESDIRRCHMPSAKDVAAACAEPPPTQMNKTTSRFVIVEFGAGNANFLYTFCPPDPLLQLRCYGVELVPALSSDAHSYQGHISVATGTKSPLRGASATHVLLHSLLGLVSPRDACASLHEGLRLLVGGGRMLIVLLSMDASFVWFSRYHPFFFNSTAASGNAPKFAHSPILHHCSLLSGENYSQLVDTVEFLWNAPQFPFYTPHLERTGFYIVRLTRSSKQMGSNLTETQRTSAPSDDEAILYKRMCAKPENLHLIRGAQSVWAERVLEMHYSTVRKKIRKGQYIWLSKRP